MQATALYCVDICLAAVFAHVIHAGEHYKTGFTGIGVRNRFAPPAVRVTHCHAGHRERDHRIHHMPCALLGIAAIDFHDDVLAITKDLTDHLGQQPLGTEFDEYPRTISVHRFDHFSEHHGLEQLPAQAQADLRGVLRVGLPVAIAVNRTTRYGKFRTFQVRGEAFGSAVEQRRMERAGNRKVDVGYARYRQHFTQTCDGSARAAYYLLGWCVEITDPDVALALEHALNLAGRRLDCDHRPRIGSTNVGHSVTTGASESAEALIIERTSGPQRGQFAEAVTTDHIDL